MPTSAAPAPNWRITQRNETTSSRGLMLVSLPLITLAQQQTSAEIQTLKVQGNRYLLTGAGSNVAVQIGDTGVLVVDTGKAETAEKVVAAIRRLSDKPIQYIVNTHMHA